MSTKIPPGWGFSPEAVAFGAAPMRRESAEVESLRNKSRRRNHRDQRQTYMRFALWAAQLGRDPLPGEICDRFGVHWETARRLIKDWKAITEETP